MLPAPTRSICARVYWCPLNLRDCLAQDLMAHEANDYDFNALFTTHAYSYLHLFSFISSHLISSCIIFVLSFTRNLCCCESEWERSETSFCSSMTDIHLLDTTNARVKPPPTSQGITSPFLYAPSDDGTDENLVFDRPSVFGELGSISTLAHLTSRFRLAILTHQKLTYNMIR